MGLTAIDTGVLIAFLDRTDAFHTSATTALVDAVATGPSLLPGIAYAEALVMMRRADVEADWFDTMLERLRISVGSCTKPVLRRGSELRATALGDRRRRQWKMSDALIVAESIESGAAVVLTTDSGWPPLSEGPYIQVLPA